MTTKPEASSSGERGPAPGIDTPTARTDAGRRRFARLPHLLGFAAIAALYLAGGLETAEFRMMDARFRALTRPASSDLVVVDIDPRSLRELQRWPWPRSYHATVIDRLVEAGARQIAFDVEFSSTSVPRHDLALEQALAGAGGKVILAAFVQSVVDVTGASRIVSTAPLAAFRQHARIASINVRPAADSVVREIPVRVPWKGGELPTLAALLADRPASSASTYYVDFGYQPATVQRVSYVDVLEGRADPALLSGKQIIVGATAIELGDQVPVPLYRSLPGPLLQALSYNTLRGDPLVRAGVAPVLTVTALCALLVGPWFARWSWRRGLASLMLSSGGFFALSVAAQAGAALLIDIIPWMLMVFASFVAEQVRRIDRQSLQLLLQGIEIRRKDALMSHVVENSFDGILTIDRAGALASINPAAERMFGYRADGILGQSALTLLPALQHDPTDADLPGEPGEMSGWRSDGTSFPAEVFSNEIDAGERRLRTVFIRDITQRKKQEQALIHQAMHDSLTTLPNRHLLLDRLQHGLRDAERDGNQLALFLLDLDRFKEINDTLGHHVGDLLLQAIGPRLDALVSESGTVARLGGDEFAILLPIADEASAKRLSGRALECLQTPFEVSGLSLEVGASIGIALYPDHGVDALELLQKADVAMYAAKSGMHRCAVYDSESDRHSVRELTLSGTLRRAIEEGHLELYYQPKMDLSTERVLGVEALVRWHHAEHGFIRPDEFITLAEQTGLIHPLSFWVLDTAAAQCASWRARGLDLGVAINLSARTLADNRLAERVTRCIHRHGISPDWLTLEITESTLMSDPERALSAIDQLHDVGLRFSIDDFGTGYSSLAYLKRLPAAELKIDKSFIQDIDSEDGSLRIVKSTIDLAHGFGMTVVAEGIESAATVDTLRSLSCDVGQGYHFARPLAASDFDAWLASDRSSRSSVSSIPSRLGPRSARRGKAGSAHELAQA